MTEIIGRSSSNRFPTQSVMNGAGIVLLVDKPMDWTSFDVVAKIRSLFNLDRIGHAGTLDPRATGLLIVCTGKKTKAVSGFAELEKEYEGVMTLGKTTPSFDSETEVLEVRDIGEIHSSDVARVLTEFKGKQLQTPPMYSAVKRKGKPLYKYARKGRIVEREPKEIEIKEILLLDFQPPDVRFRVVCSKGTYIRSLVHDVGARLGCGAMLSELRRTRIGPYDVHDALTIGELAEFRKRLRLAVIPFS